MKLLSALFSLTCLFFIGCGGNDSSAPDSAIPMQNLTLSNNESSNVRPLKASLDPQASALLETLDGGRNVLAFFTFDDRKALDLTELNLVVQKAPIVQGTIVNVEDFVSLNNDSIKYKNEIASLLPDGSLGSFTGRYWYATSGQIAVEELTETYVVVRFSNIRFVFDPLEDTEGRPNDAEGEFSLNGTVRLPVNYN